MFKLNDYVWCCFGKKYWPGIIIDPIELGVKSPKKDHVWVFWFGDSRWSEMSIKGIHGFARGFSKFYSDSNKKSKKWHEAVIICIREYGRHMTDNWTDKQLVEWGKDGFATNSSFSFRTDTPNVVREAVRNVLGIPANMLPANRLPAKFSANSEQKELIKKCQKDIKLYASYKFCFGCYTSDVSEEHPIFLGRLCRKCKDGLKLTLQSYGENGVKAAKNNCIVCGRSGKTIACNSILCEKAFCYICIDNLAATNATSTILKMKKWNCFICKTNEKYCGLLQVRDDWKNKVQLLFTKNTPTYIVMPPTVPLQKRGIRVLSLFDPNGIGLSVMKKLISIDAYYIRNKEKNVLEETLFLNEKLKHLQDAIIDKKIISDISPIDFVLGIDDPKCRTELFFEFYRIIDLIKEEQKNKQTFFWMFVSDANEQHEALITRFLECKPINLEHNKPRLFWGNLPLFQEKEENDIDTFHNLMRFLPDYFKTL